MNEISREDWILFSLIVIALSIICFSLLWLGGLPP